MEQTIQITDKQNNLADELAERMFKESIDFFIEQEDTSDSGIILLIATQKVKEVVQKECGIEQIGFT